MYNPQDIASRINHMSKSRGIRQKIMLEDCGLNKNVISTMLSRGSMPKADNIAKIADYLHCSVDYLLGRADTPDAMHPQTTSTESEDADYIMTTSIRETKLLIDYRNLNKQGKEYVLQTMDLAKSKYEKKHTSYTDMEDIG